MIDPDGKPPDGDPLPHLLRWDRLRNGIVGSGDTPLPDGQPSADAEENPIDGALFLLDEDATLSDTVDEDGTAYTAGKLGDILRYDESDARWEKIVSTATSIPDQVETAIYYGHPDYTASAQTGILAPAVQLSNITDGRAAITHRLKFTSTPQREFPDADADIGLEFENDNTDLADVDLDATETVADIPSETVFRLTDPDNYHMTVNYHTDSTWDSGAAPAIITLYRAESGTDDVLWRHHLRATRGNISGSLAYSFHEVTTSNSSDLYYYLFEGLGAARPAAYNLVIEEAY